MAVLTPIASGLGGAIGSSYLRGRNQVLFVEYSTGKLSVVDLIRPVAATVSSGTTTLQGTWLFDFDAGVQGTSGDVWWEQQTSTQRRMTASGGAKIVNLGVIDFEGLSAAQLQQLVYSTTPIPGNTDGTNQLVNGDVFAVLTNLGNYAKVQVIQYDYNIKLKWVTYRLGAAYHTLGTGYTQPESVVVASNETTAYVTERSGTLLKVNLSSANRASAAVVATGMVAPQQIALDEDRGYAYVVEYANPGRLLRIHLASNTQTVLVSDLSFAVGLLLTKDLRFAYVSEQPSSGGRISRIELGTGRHEVLLSGMTNPFFMSWADSSEGSFYVTERDPANRITQVDLKKSPVAGRVIATGVPVRPSSAIATVPGHLVVCGDTVISDVALVAPATSGIILMGIGHVPADRIFSGYADTTGDTGYFYQVKDSPFGGTLPIMFNHAGAFAAGARYYKLIVDGIEPLQSWSDYCWDASTSRFVLRTIAPEGGGFYRVRAPGELWYNTSLGYRLNTAGLTNGQHIIGIRLYSAASSGAELGSASEAGRSVTVRIDNAWPTAVIDRILHDGNAVGTCQIVDSGSDEFSFLLTAYDPEGHLMSWSLSALWGDNKSAQVTSGSYVPNSTRQWKGVLSGTLPSPAWHATVSGDATSRRCAHTFYLSVWDRVIDGYNYLHRADYHKSITIMLP